MPLGFALLITPFVYSAPTLSIFSGIICGLALIAFSIRRGPIVSRYGAWERLIK